ncbi:MAG: EAL domain-containing protein [Hyphomicrobium sp.]
MSPDTLKLSSDNNRFTSGSNIVILVSIFLVSISIALGLNIHFGMDIALASVVGFSLFVGLVGFQVWQRTSFENQALKEEIDFLEAEVERIRSPSNSTRKDTDVYKPVKIPIQTSFLENTTPPPSGASISVVKGNDVDQIQQRIKDMLNQVSSTEPSAVSGSDLALPVSSPKETTDEQTIKTDPSSLPERSLGLLRNAMQSLRSKPKAELQKVDDQSLQVSAPAPSSEVPPTSLYGVSSLSSPEDAASPLEPITSPQIVNNSSSVADLAAVKQALEIGRLDVFLEPILSLGEHTAKHYEVSINVRGAGNEDLGPFEIKNARGTSILPFVDTASFQRSALIAERLASQGREGFVFTRSCGETILDANFNYLVEKEYIGRQSVFRQMVLCLTQSDIRSFRAEEQRAVGKLSSLGFRFAVLDVNDLDMNFEAMARAGFCFVRLDKDVLADGLSTPSGKLTSPEIAGYLAKRDFTLIVNGIDSEESLSRLYAEGVLFGQGSLFGGPRPVKADLVSRSAQAAA